MMFNENDIIKGIIFKSNKPLTNKKFIGFMEMDKGQYQLVKMIDNIYMAYIIDNGEHYHQDIINKFNIDTDEMDMYGISLIDRGDKWLIDGYDLNRLNYFPEFKEELIDETKEYYGVKNCDL